ncbi:TIGR04290 family methyltransferase [Cytophagaceae bacterium ABcell3]|nr:TIGR04290 family methyltransferase [Cytophagaceae bacterium ABcell3]
MKEKDITDQIQSMQPWFHNIHLPSGVQTAPDHFLGDFPSFKWQALKDHIPADLNGWKVLDIGCNAGFYSIELAKRGADVLGIDLDPHYLRQAEWVAEQFRLPNKIRFKQMQVYDLVNLNEDFDLIWFMGVFYHLRYPLLAMDILSRKVKEMLVFQTLSMPGEKQEHVPDDVSLEKREVFLKDEWPKMAFIEKKYAGDPTNWWAPNPSAMEAIIRSCGMEVVSAPLDETLICKPVSRDHWNESEYLSAIGMDWKKEAEMKVKK